MLAKPVSIGSIFLDLVNPRHVPFANEDQVTEYLCSKEDVLPLARDITKIGLNPLERVALIPIKGQKASYTMAEGNRRLCALKLLVDPDRAPARLRKSFALLAAQRPPPKEFWAVSFNSNDEVRPWLERMHNGVYEGRGRKAWNLSSPHGVIRAKCQCMAGLGGADPVGPGMLGSMGSPVSITSGAGGR